jgi:hypothetical protein
MGRISELQIELQAAQTFASHISMLCPNCEFQINDDLPVPEPDCMTVGETKTFLSECTEKVNCKNCKSQFICQISFANGVWEGSLVKFPNHVVQLEPPRYWPPMDDWLRGPPSKSPYNDLTQTLAEVKSIVKKTGHQIGSSLINRMCFSQIISAFEAYLSDTLLNGVNNNFEKMAAVAETDLDLKKQKYSLTEVSKGKEFVSEQVVTHLRSLVYHNLPRIDPLFKAAFNTSIIKNSDDLRKFMSYINDRHNCVHRNGRNKDDEPPAKFTANFVLEAIEFILSISSELENNAEIQGEEIPF